MIFEKHLHSVSSAALQTPGILKKFWRVFHDQSLKMRCFRGFTIPVWSTFLRSLVRLPIYTFGYLTVHLVGPVSLLVVEFNLSHRRSVAILCILYKITSNPMNLLCGALPLPFCARADYTLCLGRSSAFVCTSSLPKITALQDFIPRSASL